jgi:hypothetical protein
MSSGRARISIQDGAKKNKNKNKLKILKKNVNDKRNKQLSKF